jgi:hypothetical protein
MARPRRCRVCQRRFTAKARAGDRQRLCGDEACQRERHRLACKAWHQRGRDERVAEAARSSVKASEVELDWAGVSQALGPVAAEVARACLEVAASQTRDAVLSITVV